MPLFSPEQNKVNHVTLFFKKNMLLSNVWRLGTVRYLAEEVIDHMMVCEHEVSIIPEE